MSAAGVSPSPLVFDAEVVGLRSPAVGVAVLSVRVAQRAAFTFQAGQYVYLQLAGFEPRAFSLASSPDEEWLEFHVRDQGHGLSAALARPEVVGGALKLSAAQGDTVYQPSARPVLVVAGGLGIVPMKALVQAALQAGQAPLLHLYWGVRTVEQAYLDGDFSALKRRYPAFVYIPVYDELPPAAADQSTELRRQGNVLQALGVDAPDLRGWDVYGAGPPAMMQSLLPVLRGLGAADDHIFCDMF